MEILRKIKRYTLQKEEAGLDGTGFLSGRFLLELPDVHSLKEGEFFRVPGALSLRILTADRDSREENAGSLRGEGCFYYREKGERILEACFRTVRADRKKDMTAFVRLPLSAPFCTGTISLYFDGTWLRFMKDGVVLNENSGYDDFLCEKEEVFLREDGRNIRAFSVTGEQTDLVCENQKMELPYLTPYWWNANAGDVMNFYHDGVYHLLYLLDRRHHGSRGGCGAHYVAHLTTRDFRHWEEQEDPVGITAPYMNIGTGTLFFQNGKYYMSYGLHTERYTDCLAVPSLCPETGKWNRISFEEALRGGKYPAGASYAVSRDGKHFEQSGWLIHAARNPSIYPEASGLKLYAGYAASGVWQAENIEQPFEKCEESFDFANGSVMRNSTECPSFFEWNGYRYLLIGFTGYFRTKKNSGEFFDAAAAGEQVYDGLCVPMVTSFSGNRRMVSGWLNGAGWASLVVHRELIQQENGSLAMKWVEETLADLKSGRPESFSAEEGYCLDSREDAGYFEWNLHIRKNGKASLFFLNDDGEGCELQWDAARGRMQFSDAQKDGTAFGDPLDTVLEKMQKADPAIRDFHPLVGNDTPQSSVNFALSAIPFEEANRVRLVVSYIRRLNSTVIDVEFAGKKTAVSLRNGLRVKVIRSLTENASLKEGRVIRTPISNRDVLARFFETSSHS